MIVKTMFVFVCAVECNARDMKAVRHIVDGAKAMCTSLRSWLHRKDSVVRAYLHYSIVSLLSAGTSGDGSRCLREGWDGFKLCRSRWGWD